MGKITLDMPFYELIKFTLIDNFKILPVAFQHTFVVSTLENHHKDPFDRMLIAQAITDNLKLISIDTNIKKYKGV